MDGTGLDMLKLVIFELKCVNIEDYLARCSKYMLRMLEVSDAYDGLPREHVFIDLPDAVEQARKMVEGKRPHHVHHIVEMHKHFFWSDLDTPLYYDMVRTTLYVICTCVLLSFSNGSK
ncbi:hypothetical protein DPMN_026193 [Dreissena polymorpha]|uniref:STAS domain-containing protein n=1 Tax=Dreissena polymorpha TaxID=45954 RepID=A0A9D4LR73_DREPO|nr:hypothetical protein DPMN_026193 [Dreissena polymorpha]